MKKDFKVFKSDEGRRKILSHYSRLLGTVGFAYRERYVDTSFGKTYILEAGDPGKPPVVLIHGSCSNSAAWFGDIPVLSEAYHVFSADVIGDAGNSEENRLDQTTDDFENWLAEVFDGLGVEKAMLIGNSLGGWIALKFAVRFPERTEKLALIAPSGIVPNKPSFLQKTIFYLMMGEKGRKAMSRMIFGSDNVPEEVLAYTKMIGDNFNPLTGAMPDLTDGEMRKLTMPLLYIAGENDATSDVGKATKRLKEFVPNAEIRVIENNGHVLYDTMKWVLPFLEK
jgi:pimeloyl-ACP methyl ester carboxylesterase